MRWVPLLALLCIVAGCPTTEITESDPPVSEPPAPTPPEPPPPAPAPPPPPPSGGPSLDPGFNPSSNLIDLFYDAQKTPEENGSALRSQVGDLQAGDRLVIHAGTYVVNSRFGIWSPGTEAAPVTIEGAEGELVVITRDNNSQNTVNVDGGSYLTLKNLEITGGDTGLKIYGFDHLYVCNCHIHHTDESAITANSDDTSFLYLVDNHIHHVEGNGEGFYLGANNGKYITHHTYVVGNHVHDTAGSQGDGIEIKTGSYACVVSDNLIEDTRYPGILVYGNGGNAERNIIERNIILRSAEGGIQVAADAIVRNNLIIDCDDACIVSQSHQGASPEDLTIVHNTLINSGRGLRVSDWDGPNIVAANNAIYSGSGREISGSTSAALLSGNVFAATLAAWVGVSLDGVQRDATPAPGSVLRGAGDAAHVTRYDLHDMERTGPVDAGAVDGD